MTSLAEKSGTNPKADSRKISLLLVCRSYPPVIGGSEIEAQRVCAGLLGRGHKVQVVCCGGDPMPQARKWVDPYGVPVVMYGSGPGKVNDYRYAFGVAWKMLKERQDFDLVYFLMPGVHVALGVPLARALGLPCVMKFAGSSEIHMTQQAAIGPLEIAALRRWCARTMVLNDGMIDEALGAGFERDRLLWMPNPVDTELYSPCDAETRRMLRAEFGLDEQDCVATFVGRLAPEKELPSLVAAFRHVVDSNRHAKLVLIGDGPMRPALTQQVRDLGIAPNVVFAGMQNTAQIARRLQASDVFTLVSSREGLPVSLIEAMAVGLPAVVTDLPGTAQLIDNDRNGYRVPVHDERAIADALLRLFADPALRASFGAVARPAVVAKFSTATVLDAYEDLFRVVLGGEMRQ